MRGKMILPAAITIVLATATGAFAQVSQYDRSGDHMYSYGTGPYPSTSYHQSWVEPTRVHVRHGRHHPVALDVPIDRTGDHMIYYGPIAQ